MEKINYLVVYYLAFLAGFRQDEANSIAAGYNDALSRESLGGEINFCEKFKAIREEKKLQKKSFIEFESEKLIFMWQFGQFIFREQKGFSGDDLSVIQQIYDELAKVSETEASLTVHYQKILEYLEEFSNSKSQKELIFLIENKFVLSDHMFFKVLTSKLS